MNQSFESLAGILDQAARNSNPVEQLSLTSKITINDAYHVQAASISRRYNRGEILTGLKLGFTSKAKMEQMGVHDMIWGRLTNSMSIPYGGELYSANFIHPRAEPEIAFRLGCDISGPITLEEARDVIDAIAPAIEIIDSRYEKFKFSLEDVIADNCSSAAYVLGEWQKPNVDVSDVEITLNVNGKTAQTGNSNAILGNPLQSVVAAVRLAHQYGETLYEGMIILAGAATPAAAIQAGDYVEGTFTGFSSVHFNVR